jgi:hypothetical protein
MTTIKTAAPKKTAAAAPSLVEAAAVVEAAAPAAAAAAAAAAAPAPISERQAKKDAFRAGQETVRAIQGELLAMRKSGETVLSANAAEMIKASMIKTEPLSWEGKGYIASQTKGQLAPIGENATPSAWERGAACELNRMLAPLHGFGVRIVRYTSDKGTTYSGFLTLFGR